MLNYLARRLLIGLVTLLCITFLVYGLIRQMPGDPTTVAINESDPSKKLDKAALERKRKEFFLDEPFPVGYAHWLGNVCRGDLGRSEYQKQPVIRAIGQRVGPTLYLSLTSLLLAYAAGMPIGLYASARSGRLDERLVSVVLYMLFSFPSFVAALLLQYFFAFRLEWLPLNQMHTNGYETWSTGEQVLDFAKHSILPVICYTYGSLAYYSRFIRANMAEALQQDYIRTARAKGAGYMRVLVKHAFRNTLIPMATLLGLTLPGLLSGTIVLELIFSWPGMGLLFLEALYARDYSLIMGLTLLFSVLTLLGTLLSDILYAWVDPRVSYS
ncbi:MAG: ABC transporter permease [Planctomycetia bacterium]|nr:ABC transporter permease [Planctomycetia bacterium]